MSDIKFIETDSQTIINENIARLQTEVGRTFYPGDPVRNITLAFSYIQAIIAAAANNAANQSFLDTASGGSLDALGALLGVMRRPAEAARCTLRFSLAAPRGDVTTISQGISATVQGSGIYFSTIETVEIAAGDMHADVIAEASVLGPTGNGFLVGEIGTIVQAVMFITSVINLTASTDGSDPEDDDSLRERIREAPTRFSIGGPEDAYIALTKDARADVEAVSINSPSPRVIDVYFTLEHGAIPASETIAEVSAYLNDKYRRPMSDVVQVHAPTPVDYTIDITYYISKVDSARVSSIQAAVSQAVSDYIAWQKSDIGRDVNPSELVKRVMNAGALRVSVTAPVYAALTFSELAVISGEPTISNGGLGDE